MLAFSDKTKEVDEQNTDRMNFRINARVKKTIQRAAQLAGVSDTVFTASAAYGEAVKTIEAHERTVLQPIDHAAFFEAMDTPPAANDKLRAAFTRYNETVVSK